MNGTKRVVLIVSTGRTGTKALAQHVSRSYPDVRAVHEPPPTRFHLRRAANRYLCGHTTRQQLVRILSVHRDRMLAETPQAVYVESNPALSGFIDAFGEVFDDFRVLHVVRDPASYIVSSLNWGVFQGVKKLLAYHLPYWLPKADRATDSAPLRVQNLETPWSQMPEIERLAWHWAMINRHLDRGRELYPDRYHRIRYEDIFARDGTGLGELLAAMDLPANDSLLSEVNREAVNASTARRCPRFEEWPAEDQKLMLNQCHDLMVDYGYPVPATLSTDQPAGRPVDRRVHDPLLNR